MSPAMLDLLAAASAVVERQEMVESLLFEQEIALLADAIKNVELEDLSPQGQKQSKKG